MPVVVVFLQTPSVYVWTPNSRSQKYRNISPACISTGLHCIYKALVGPRKSPFDVKPTLLLKARIKMACAERWCAAPSCCCHEIRAVLMHGMWSPVVHCLWTTSKSVDMVFWVFFLRQHVLLAAWTLYWSIFFLPFFCVCCHALCCRSSATVPGACSKMFDCMPLMVIEPNMKVTMIVIIWTQILALVATPYCILCNNSLFFWNILKCILSSQHGWI